MDPRPRMVWYIEANFDAKSVRFGVCFFYLVKKHTQRAVRLADVKQTVPETWARRYCSDEG